MFTGEIQRSRSKRPLVIGVGFVVLVVSLLLVVPMPHTMAVELVLPNGKKRVIFDSDARGDLAEAEFDNAKGELTVGVRGDAHIEGAQRSLVAR